VEDGWSPAAHSVLVVDDTAANRRLYSGILGKAGFQVQTACDGLEALAQIQEERPSLVLLDFVMPRMDGVAVLRKMRADPRYARVPVVMLTSSASPDDVDDALEAGANDYITKPVNSRILLTRIKSLIQADHDREQASRGRAVESLRRDLAEACRVQEAQLPHVPITWNDWRVVGAVAPSGLVGGDVFDVVITEDERLVAVLVDVSGHGTASALVAAETRVELRNLLAVRPLLESVERLNARMARRETGKYSCLAAVEVEGTTVRVLNAGLPPVVVLRGGQIVCEVSASGVPVGMFADEPYELTEFQTTPGDRIVLMSDGLTEPFGVADDVDGALQRLALVPTADSHRLDAKELREAMLRTTHSVRHADQLDDATVMVLDLVGTMNQALRITPRPESVLRAVRWVLSQSPDWVDKGALDSGLTEALTNAVFHGALEVDPNHRASSEYGDYLDEALTLVSSTNRGERGIDLSILAKQNRFGIGIRWEGAACPPGARVPPTDLSPLPESGMGMSIIFGMFNDVVWADDGLSFELWLDKPGNSMLEQQFDPQGSAARAVIRQEGK
jgi:sigma-B regulation protein RsbU (phosphoserine phosphatase)